MGIDRRASREQSEQTWRLSARRTARLRLLALALTALSALLMALSVSRGFSEWYAARIFPLLAGTVGRALSLLPVSLLELLLPPAALWALLFLIYLLLMLTRPARRRKLRRTLPQDLARLGAWAAGCLLLFVLSSGLLHNRQTFAEKNSLTLHEAKREELLQLAALLNELAVEAQRAADEAGGAAAPPGRQAGQAMSALSERVEGLMDRYPRPRATWYLHRLMPVALESPPAFEALYPRGLGEQLTPLAACRSLARLSGYRRDGEDALIALLACLYAEDPLLRSGGAVAAMLPVLAELELLCAREEFAHLLLELDGGLRAAWLEWRQAPANAVPRAPERRLVQLLAAHYRGTRALQAFAPMDTAPLPRLAVEGAALTSPHAVVMDLGSQTILYGKGEDQRAHPASLTKILTASVALDLIDNPQALLTITDRDQLGLFEQGASMSGFTVGEQVSYQDLLATLMLVSGCDSGNALAYHLTGSIEAFVAEMNARAEALGLVNSNFANPSGLTDDNQLTTAADLAVLLADALQQPLFRTLFCADTYDVPPTNLQPQGMRVNDLVFERLRRDYGGPVRSNGAVILGGKTGYTKAAGLCLAVLAEFEGRELLVVTLGGGLPVVGNEGHNYLDVLALLDALALPERAAA